MLDGWVIVGPAIPCSEGQGAFGVHPEWTRLVEDPPQLGQMPAFVRAGVLGEVFDGGGHQGEHGGFQIAAGGHVGGVIVGGVAAGAQTSEELVEAEGVSSAAGILNDHVSGAAVAVDVDVHDL